MKTNISTELKTLSQNHSFLYFSEDTNDFRMLPVGQAGRIDTVFIIRSSVLATMWTYSLIIFLDKNVLKQVFHLIFVIFIPLATITLHLNLHLYLLFTYQSYAVSFDISNENYEIDVLLSHSIFQLK